MAKLNAVKVLEIRQLYALKWSLRMLARSFKVSPSTIRSVVTFKTWAYVAPVSTSFSKYRA